MNYLKRLQTLESQISALPKLYHSHLWITPPAQDGYSYIGVSEFVKKYIVRFHKFNYDGWTKANYGIANRFYIQAFINETKQRKQKGQLSLSERIEWQRFEIKQNQPFITMETIQFDIELQAPVNMHLLGYQYNTKLFFNLLTAPYFFQVRILDPNQLGTLITQQEYNKQPKILRF